MIRSGKNSPRNRQLHPTKEVGGKEEEQDCERDVDPWIRRESIESRCSKNRGEGKSENSERADDSQTEENRTAHAGRVAPSRAREVCERHRHHREHAWSQQRYQAGADGEPEKRRAHALPAMRN